MRNSKGGRPSVCYLVPGHNLLSTAGPTRNVLSLARGLSAFADVTVAFRRVLEPVTGEPFAVLEIDPETSEGPRPVDDAAVPVVNLVPLVRQIWNRPMKAAKNWVARDLSGRYLRHAPRLIAESDDLKASMVQRWRLPPSRIEVVGLGVDRSLFHPTDQAQARRTCGISPDRTVLIYVGALDRAHDLGPVVAATTRLGDSPLELHLVGDGEHRAELERAAAGSPRVVFHGRVPHTAVPGFIACGDLCLAPYDPAFFPRGQVGYATLKIREYLAAGRPVATSRSGVLPGLIRPGATGFLLENDAATWTRFLLQELPARSVLRTMGLAAAETPLESWEDTARAYWQVCERVLARTGEAAAVG
jgi:glycosyltransferase involved in cell wall biosynthesis